MSGANRLPGTWAVVPFDTVFENVTSSNKKLQRKSYKSVGRFPVIDQGEDPIGGCTDDESLAYDGPLPVVIFGDHTRAVKYSERRFVQGADGVKVLVVRRCARARFGYWALKAANIPSRGYSRHFDLVRKLSFPLPPLGEQGRIVDAIETYCTQLDAADAALERVQQNLQRYRTSVLKAAVEGRLVPTEAALAMAEGRDYEPASVLLARILRERRHRWEEAKLVAMKAEGKVPKDDKWKSKYKEPLEPDVNGLPKLPEGWCWSSVDQLSSEVRNGVSEAPKENAGVRILRICAVRPLEVNMNDVRFLPEPVELYQDFLVRKDDLLFTRYNGTPSLVGVGGVVRHLSAPTVYPDKLIRVRVLPGAVSPDYLEIATNAGVSRQHIQSRTRTTAGQAGISGADLKATPVPLPPRDEQERLVEQAQRLWSIALAAEAEVSPSSLRCARLRQAIIKWAFEGKLVDQGATEEPTSILLERICAEGEAAKSKKTTEKRDSIGHRAKDREPA